MDEVKKSIRPSLNLPKATTENEQFQNEVLRPILKLQHDILVQLFINFCKNQKIDIINLSKEHLEELTRLSLAKNIVFRNQIFGVVIGQFCKDEFTAYSQNTSEFNKRIIQMVKKRLDDACYN